MAAAKYQHRIGVAASRKKRQCYQRIEKRSKACSSNQQHLSWQKCGEAAWRIGVINVSMVKLSGIVSEASMRRHNLEINVSGGMYQYPAIAYVATISAAGRNNKWQRLA